MASFFRAFSSQSFRQGQYCLRDAIYVDKRGRDAGFFVFLWKRVISDEMEKLD